MGLQEEFQEVQKTLENLKTEKDQLAGQKMIILKSIKKEFGVTSLAQAKKKLSQLRKKNKETKEFLENELTSIKQEFNL